MEHTENIDRELVNVWSNIKLLQGFEYGYQETPEFFIFHHLAHMSYHMVEGGCGVRPFLDLWVIEQKLRYDGEKLRGLLENCELEKFAKSCYCLTKHWVNGQQIGALESSLESYVLYGGVGGSREHRVAIKNSAAGGKAKYILSRILIPYSSLVYLYPWIEEKKYLVPIAEVLRWFTLCRKDVRMRVCNEMRLNSKIDVPKQERTIQMLNELGLVVRKGGETYFDK